MTDSTDGKHAAAVNGPERSSMVVGMLLVLAFSAGGAGVVDASAAAGAGTTATAADFAWLAGSWEGRLANTPAVAEVTFTRPNAGLVTGVMRLVDKGQILIVELIAITDAPGGTEMRFRHFSPKLEVYEKEFKQSMKLVAHDADQDRFENQAAYEQALMSTQPRVSIFTRRGQDEFVAHSDIIGDDGKPDTVEVVYHRVR